MDKCRKKVGISWWAIGSTTSVFVALLLVNHSDLLAEEQPEQRATPTFLVCPVETDLQRLCLGPAKDVTAPVKTLVAIHGSAAITKEGMIDPGLVPAAAVRAALDRVPDRQQGTVVMRLYFGTQRHAPLASDLLKVTFEGVGRLSGFKATQVQMTITNGRGIDLWNETLDALTIKNDGRADEEEAPAGDGLVEVYPVRTALSLLLTDKADCVIDVRAPLETKGNRLLSPEVRGAIIKYTSTLKFRDTGKVLFRINEERVTRERFEAFHMVEAPELARTLGFKGSAVQW